MDEQREQHVRRVLAGLRTRYGGGGKPTAVEKDLQSRRGDPEAIIKLITQEPWVEDSDREKLNAMASPEIRFHGTLELIFEENEALNRLSHVIGHINQQICEEETDLEEESESPPESEDSASADSEADLKSSKIREKASQKGAGKLESQLAEKNMPEAARERAMEEIRNYRRVRHDSSDGHRQHRYIQWILELPWDHYREENQDLQKAAAVLEESHHGMKEAKDLILERLAVHMLSGQKQGFILCLAGPPGVGKSSIAKSVARATGRDFTRISLGGINDEHTIHGHSRSWAGTTPGKVIWSIRQAGSSNPVMLLDEVDKVSNIGNHNVEGALLQLLDPEQNRNFQDQYLEVDYDLSRVLFICTANDLSQMSRPLLDRMEVIELSGYTETEKKEIAKRYLIPRQIRKSGIGEDEGVRFTDEAIEEIINFDTREAGVRELDRQISKISRKMARQAAEGALQDKVIGPAQVRKHLGARRFHEDEAPKADRIGVCTGMSVSTAGGRIYDIEAAVNDGEGKLVMTGKMGEVMRESSQAAVSLIRSRAGENGIDREFHLKSDVHIHAPEGSVSKEGPSAGITIATALFSALSGKPVRRDVAMTGEITLRGRVLGIGGIKEKIHAAQRAGIEHVLVPEENRKDVAELTPEDLGPVEVQFVTTIDEVLQAAIRGGIT